MSTKQAQKGTSLKSLIRRVLLASMTIPLVVFVIVVSVYLHSTIRNVVEDKNTNTIHLVVHWIEQAMTGALTTMKLAAEDVTGMEKGELRQSYLNAVVTSNPILTEIRLLDREGKVIAIAPNNPTILGTDMSYTSAFRHALETDRYYWSETQLSVKSGRPSLWLSVPWKSGVIAGQITLPSLEHFIKGVSVGKKTVVAILDQTGTYIAHTDRSKVLERQVEPLFSLLLPKATPIPQSVEAGLGGDERLVTIASVEPTGWVAVIFQDVDELFEPVRLFVGIATVLGVLLMIGSLLLLLRKFRVVTGHFDDLSFKAREVARGKFETRLRRQDIEELDEISMAINRMSDSVQKRERTVQLLNTNLSAKLEEITNLHQLTDLILDAAAESILGLDSEGRVLFVNPAACEMLGYSKAEMLNADYHQLIHSVHPDGTPYHVQDCPLRETLRDGKPRSGIDAFVHKNGQMLPVEFYSMPIERGGKAQGAVVTAIDITDRIAREQALVEARVSAETANKAKSSFLANMSHEIRTPLNGIVGMLQLLLTSDLDKEQKEYVDKGILSSRRLTRLLQDILDLSRVEAERLELRDEAFDLEEAVETVRQLFIATAEQKGLELHIELAPDLPERVGGDVSRLQQILSNFVGNAIKFTDHGNVTLSVSTQPFDIEGECRILFVISDTGIGIPKQQQDMLFQPFTQAESDFKRRYQGAGLGLSICKRLVDLMGGSIALVSEKGQGTTVYCSMPFRLVEPIKNYSQRAVERDEFRNNKLLLAEDDEFNRFAMVKLLTRMQFEVRAVEDGEQAVRALSREPFDLVLMDVQMPVMDGVAATKAIRKGEAGTDRSTTPIVAMTAYALSGDREKFMDAGMDGYVSKPVDIEDLRSVLQQILHQRSEKS